MNIIASGDSFITRRTVPGEALRRLADIVRSAEARFTNFEVLTPCGEGFPNAVSGGTWANAPAGVVDDLAALGFNLTSWANNHTLDYSYGGLAATWRELDRAGIVHAGVGRTLAEAAAPRYLECPSGRVALIGCSATCHDTDIAGQQRPDQAGRPGLNPLRHTTTYFLPKGELEALAAMAAASGINDAHTLRVKAGFAEPPEPGVVLFGNHSFREGPAGQSTEAKPADLARLRAAINEARRQADIVLVSLHAHEARGLDKAVPAAFVETVARSCIEAGADAVLGHGPHVPRGIEIHQDRPIFYSLGNFFFQNETVENLPSDFYEKYGMGLTESTADGIDKRSANNTRGFVTDPWIWKSVMPRFVIEDGKLAACDLFAIELGGETRPGRGTPRLSEDPSILAHLAELSAPYGTRIAASGGVGRIEL
jgi:poly-gamma-glutamate synthesis protein (capsule biosynthesis protein)